MNFVVVSGKKYIDIDAYASMIAYRELLRSEGKNAAASSLAVTNESVPKFILDFKYRLDSVENFENFGDFSGAKFIVVDTSNPEFFDERVSDENLFEIIDHHTGFEEYWKKFSGVRTQIEFIGSVCTIVFEKIVTASHVEILDEELCKLLISGILDNTLNLKSSITTERDREAYRELLRIGGVSEDFYVEYFSACEAEILKDFEKAIRDDLKFEKVGDLPEVVGQMIVLRPEKFDVERMKKVFREYPEWMMNVISLEDGKSYLYFHGDGVRERLEKLFGKECEAKGLIVLDEFLLRKQIMKKAREAS